jgi:hypothetical protein
MKRKGKITNVQASGWSAVLEDLRAEITTAEERLAQLRQSEVSVREKIKKGDVFPLGLFGAPILR